MKRGIRIVCLLLIGLLLVGCVPESTTAPESSGAELTEKALQQIKTLGTSPDDNYRTWYELFIYSFCDSDGDGIGDIQGVISQLDYLQELGVNGIWFMPIHPSSTYHKYNVHDYYAIDPAYGTMEDFDALMAECQKRDIHVILDLVVNHTGSEHPWFKEAVSYLQSLPAGAEPKAEECKYLDYYYFSKEKKSSNRIVNGTDWYYEGVFDYQMPDLNWGSEAVRSEVKAIMEFWLNKGVAGFRVDAAKEFYTGMTDPNIEVLNWLQTTATSIKPDCYMVAEVWDSFSQITEYYKSGFTGIFNYAFGNSNGKIISVLRGAGQPGVVSTYATALEKADKAYLTNNPDYIDAPFLSNHDVGRIAGFVGRDENKIKLAGAMNLFMSGSAFIYYGEEIGMVGAGNDPSKRAPMYWNAERNNGTTNPPPECDVPASYPYGSLAEQKDSDSSIYNYYRQAVAIRQALPVISHGRTTAETALNIGCVSAQRKTWGEENCIILMNIDENAAKVDLSGYADWKLVASLSANGEAITMNGSDLNLPAYGVAVLLPQ
ncbi:MAG: DUF3459 domain-containing protein [Oscillospiraceae bacterium]|nr:DUF3459 domain-containing protein [Oscillospiraceae bacterium]